jgi:hypothetical protein
MRLELSCRRMQGALCCETRMGYDGPADIRFVMPAKYLPLIAEYEKRIAAELEAGHRWEAVHLLDRLAEVRYMRDFPAPAEPVLQKVLEDFRAKLMA